ncbi:MULTISPECIES: endonuclease/exonuclease/phosphatase family protein [unclassified Lentimicrobium]|uniref:endonuclease/exonuclease/phosphatase family protein n=1 Tax=unclassified Lentimicrobium TaxID=2677434 RepID=UPI0015559C67|nr:MULTISPECIES: endonuclease/exonuclease/phosphatase family protein [unclassified Lentimicrobium]NPD44120.1 T9SS type A sorting domain-containing protein [Lentimicrobium sp. S6]NPD86707.1 T9SS type A sorting domain-containing protein [Lentimicrobium sp. L6]
MKKHRYIILVLAVLIFSNKAFTQSFPDLHFGTDNTLDIVSWNIEWFPKEGQTTINNVKGIVDALDAEIIAVQEVDSKTSFQQLINQLADYDGYYLNDDYQSLAYLFKKSEVQVMDRYEIYTSSNYWSPFPRSPLIVKIKFRNEIYYIINNHLKCCGDGNLDPYDTGDEEARRLRACNLLDDYIEGNLSNDKVIVLGDMNDEITDRSQDNVFTTFLSKPSKYSFADMRIAESSSSGWSYPDWPSHLDHILLTNELFEQVEQDGSSCEVIRLDDHFYGGFNEYENKVSDHRPVGIRIKAEAQGIFNLGSTNIRLKNAPNPITQSTVFTFPAQSTNGEISIFNSSGILLEKIMIPENTNSIIWHPQNKLDGIYYSQFRVDDKTISSGKILIITQ